MPRKSSSIDVTDLFCGAGGSSLGASWAGAEIKLAMNHWKRAIETHNTNFPNTDHALVDISKADPRHYRSTRVLIASPECTNHSLAKGVKRKGAHYTKDLFGNVVIDPAEERSRVTMWDVVRFAEFHQYDAIIVENVVDARRWVLFDPWLHAMKNLGYEYEAVYFNSMFAHPTPQSRDRMYVVFWRKGVKRPNLRIEPRAFCERCGKDVDAFQYWKKIDSPWGKYGKRNQYEYACPVCKSIVQPYYFAAANAIDWTQIGERIGDRVRPLKPRTLERIEYGLKKFGAQAMMIQTDYTHSDSPRARTLDDVMPTQSTRQVLGLMMPLVLSSNAGSGDSSKYVVRSAGDALPTQMASGQPSIVMPFIIAPNHRGIRAIAVDDPLFTQTGSVHGALVMPFVLTHGKDFSAKSPLEALSTIVGGGNHHFLVSKNVIVDYSNDTLRGVAEPLNTFTTKDKYGVLQVGDLPNVDDCYFRMLNTSEIKRGMAFPDEYVITGNNREQIKQAGNAVTPPVPALLMSRLMEVLA